MTNKEQTLYPFVVVIEDYDVYLIGPFENRDEAAEWGRKNRSPGGPDDPRWQTVSLPVGYEVLVRVGA